MFKTNIILLYLLFFYPDRGLTQQKNNNNIRELSVLLQKAKPDTNRVRILLSLSDYYFNKTAEGSYVHDSANFFLSEAEALGSRLQYNAGVEEGYLLTEKILIRDLETKTSNGADTKEELRKIKEYEDKLLKISDFMAPQHKGEIFSMLARLYYERDETYPDITRLEEMAIGFFRQAGNDRKVAEGLLHIGEMQLLAGNLPMAEKYLLEGIDVGHATGKKDLQRAYSKLGNVYANKADFKQALKYGLESEKIAEEMDDHSQYMSFLYNYLANTYGYIKDEAKAIEYNRKALLVAEKYKDAEMVSMYANNIVSKIVEKDPKEAANLLEDVTRRFPLKPDNEYNIVVYSAFLKIYSKLNDSANAEIYCNKLLAEAKKIPTGSPKLTLIYRPAINYYLNSGQFQRAAEYVDIYGQIAESRKILPFIVEYNKFKYKIDSGLGNSQLALKQYIKYKNLFDSVNNIKQEKEVAQIRGQYEAEKKDRELVLRKKDIDLLKKQAQLQDATADKMDQDLLLREKDISLLKKEKELQRAEAETKDRDLQFKDQNIQLGKRDIALLRSESLLQQSSLRQTKTTRNVIIGGAGMLLLLLALLYNRYRVGQKARDEITNKNAALQGMVQEKEWLLKEIHHRVKNNLHTITSLLESQSAYLQDDALTAIKDSQHRVQAMSLIHQKLFQSETLDKINMGTYIHELVDYLKNSFDTRQRIRFILDVAAVELDISQAVPLGLILNEVITNSVKYAFPQDYKSNIIHISMQQEASDNLRLTVEDNGVGLPNGSEAGKKGSLGMILMKGLAREIKAGLNIENIGGTKVSLQFKINPFSHIASKI